jgi:hypothetical protein
MAVPMIETAKEPRHPNRFEKKANTILPPLLLVRWRE